MNVTYDFAIIGSGVSGGRIAGALHQSGAKCVLLEAGRRFDANSFPDNELDTSVQLFWGGGLEMSADGHLGFLRGKALGGTSIVNQALVDRLDDLAFDDWRFRSGISFFNLSDMKPHYEAIEKELSIQTIPEQFRNRNAKIFSEAMDKNGYIVKPLQRAQSDCQLEQGSDCIVCLGGCPRDSKQSSLVTSIQPAEKNGLTVETEYQVHSLIDRGDHVIVRGKQHNEKKTLTVRKAILAAGAFGNTRILLNSPKLKRLPALGKYFTCHPQFMSYGFFKEDVAAHKGAFQSLKSADPKLRRSGYKFENVFAPPIATAVLMPGLGKTHLANMKQYRHLASIEICLRDEPVGSINTDMTGKLKVQKSLTMQDRRRLEQGKALLQELFESVGAEKVVHCEQGFGLHLMGGCRIGVNPRRSVVNPEFQLHDHPNIYAADSSIFPSAPGINPSLTIMALTHKATQMILKGAAG